MGSESAMFVASGTIVVYADIGCPWSHAAMHRLQRARKNAGLESDLQIDVRAFPLELINGRPTPKMTLDLEVAVLGGAAPEAGWQMWNAPAHEYPVTTLPALEAVEAAKEQGFEASFRLDLALRRAFFRDSRCVSMRHVIADVADSCDGVDVAALEAALDSGRARGALAEHLQHSRGGEVKGSPHLFLPDGSDVHNPGIELRWVGEKGRRFPVIDADRPEVYDEIVRRAAG
ncbi:MAG TPA: DsbA family protein [Actinomycetota bacterium]|nr:DsbA family protein [Actinomycetota bacterium]